MRKLSFLFVGIMAAALSSHAANTITSTQAKLVGDGVTLNTQAIQRAIDQLSAKGGGTLVLLPGHYLTGSIEMKSGVELHLQRGAELLGSTNPDDYFDTYEAHKELPKTLMYLEHTLISGNGAHDFKVTGEGVVNGQGRALALHIDSLHYKGIQPSPEYNVELQRPDHRPTLFSFRHCKNVEVSGLLLTNSSHFCMELYKCEDVHVHHFEIVSRAFWNNDGIDILDCHRVEVDNGHLNTSDDGIVLNVYDPDGTTDSVYIHDCAIESSASALKFGTPSYGMFQNVHIARVKVSNTFRSAVALEAVDGGSIKNVLVEDIDAFNVGNPIFIRLGHRHSNRIGTVGDITIRRMYCETAFERPDEGYDVRGPIVNTMINPLPGSITGLPEHLVKNVTIEDVTLVYPGGASKGLHYIPTWNLDRIPEQTSHYPEFDMFGELPSYAFFVRHADGVTFRNVRLKLKHDDFRPAFVLDDAKNVKFENISYPLGKTEGQVYDSANAAKP